MATIEMDGLSALSVSLDKLAAMPDDVMGQMLTAGADVLAQAQQESADAHGLRDTGMMIESIKAGRPRRSPDGGDIAITPEGTRRRGNTETRNAEIAYINEYGKDGQPGTGFIREANDKKEADAVGASEKIYNTWLDRIEL